jgi:hypothetical protein
MAGRKVLVMSCIAAVLTNPFWGALAGMTLPDPRAQL